MQNLDSLCTGTSKGRFQCVAKTEEEQYQPMLRLQVIWNAYAYSQVLEYLQDYTRPCQVNRQLAKCLSRHTFAFHN